MRRVRYNFGPQKVGYSRYSPIHSVFDLSKKAVWGSKEYDNGKGKRRFVAPRREHTSLRRSGMARDLSFTCTPRVHPLME